MSGASRRLWVPRRRSNQPRDASVYLHEVPVGILPLRTTSIAPQRTSTSESWSSPETFIYENLFHRWINWHARARDDRHCHGPGKCAATAGAESGTPGDPRPAVDRSGTRSSDKGTGTHPAPAATDQTPA